VPAHWTAEPSQTPGDRFYAFVHVLDPFLPRDRVVWPALGMNPQPASWRRPAGQVLMTQLPVRPGCRAPICPHMQVVGDHAVPEDEDGIPLFLEAWVYLGNPASQRD
jgi:hypothetical protein